jgi:hypothetical protein
VPEGSFSIKDVGAIIAKALGLVEGDILEVRKDRLDRNRVLVIRYPRQNLETSSTPSE